MKVSVVKLRYIFYTLSGVLVLASVLGLAVWGLKPSVDFTGGSQLQVTYNEVRPPIGIVNDALKDLNLNVTVQPLGKLSLLLQFPPVDEPTHQKILGILESIFQKYQDNETLKKAVASVVPKDKQADFYKKTGKDVLTEDQFNSVGPVIGKELINKSITALILVVAAIALYVTWAFRKVAGFVPSWHYGVITLITLFHDVVITVGVFAFLGHFLNVEVGAPFVAAVLTAIGYSVNDTVVVFDRIRENITRHTETNFANLVDVSMRQTFGRSFNTSFTVFITLLAILILGGETLHYFVLALLVAVIVGTYSSIFLASPLLVSTALKEKGKRR